MRVSQQEKNRSHARIVESAARLFRERGIEGASVSDVMHDAGLTHGGFYRHFDNKDALLVAALETAFGQLIAPLEAKLSERSPSVVREGFRAFYLSDGHVRNPGLGCPAAALSGDVSRGSETVKHAFGAGFSAMVAVLSRAIQGPAAEQKNAAIRLLATLVGAVMIARASDPETARSVLAACQASDGDCLKGGVSSEAAPNGGTVTHG